MNKLLDELINYTDLENAKYIEELVSNYILKKYGEDYLSLTGVCAIQPSELCKIVGDDADIFSLICQIICMYKFNNNLEIGFDSNKYVIEYVAFREKQQRKKQKYKDRRVRKVCKQIIEEFPDDLITEINIDDYINFLKKRNAIKILTVNEAMNDYTNHRKGKVTALIPFKKYKPQLDIAVWWICKCDCGNLFSLRNNNIKGRTSCKKCITVNYIGQKHCNLTVIEQRDFYKKENFYKQTLLKVKCNCGNIKIMSVKQFQNRRILW